MRSCADTIATNARDFAGYWWWHRACSRLVHWRNLIMRGTILSVLSAAALTGCFTTAEVGYRGSYTTAAPAGGLPAPRPSSAAAGVIPAPPRRGPATTAGSPPPHPQRGPPRRPLLWFAITASRRRRRRKSSAIIATDGERPQRLRAMW